MNEIREKKLLKKKNKLTRLTVNLVTRVVRLLR